MFTNKRSTSLNPFVVLFAFALLLLVPVVTAVAQIDPVRTSPTQAPTATMGALQANPTQPPEPDPIDDFRANPTNTPRPPVIDDVVANPTAVPRGPDDVVANPTHVPVREIDDVVANPTEAPGIDDEAIPTTGTVRVVKRDCPPGVVKDATLSDYLTICSEQHDGVEFVLNDVDGAQAGVTSGGQVEWTGVDPGVFNITETLPVGYSDPIVFCGYTESPGGGIQHPALQESTNGIVAGTFPDAMFEYGCYWLNIPTEASETVIDDVQANPTNPPETVIDDFQANSLDPGTLTVRKWVCPAFYDPLAGSPLDDCAEALNGVVFELDNHDPGEPDLESTTGDVIDGAAFFEPEPGTYSLIEQIPDGYDQPFLWDCTGLDNPAVVAPPISTINFFRIVIDSGQDIECDWMNVVGNDNHIVRVLAYACPEGVNPSGAYWTTSTDCVDPMDGVAVSLTIDGGTVDGLTDASGRFSWTDVDLGDSGEIQIVESIPAGAGEPEVWCVSSPEEAGDAQDYEFFQVQAVDGLVTASPEQHEPYRFSCFFFHGQGAGGVGVIDDVIVANPTEAPETLIDDFQPNPTESA